MSRLRWTGSGKNDRAGFVDGVQVFSVFIVEYGCRHNPGPFWGAAVLTPDGSGRDQGGTCTWITGGSGGLLSEAKSACRAYLEQHPGTVIRLRDHSGMCPKAAFIGRDHTMHMCVLPAKHPGPCKAP